jgi:hypothetical protein
MSKEFIKAVQTNNIDYVEENVGNITTNILEKQLITAKNRDYDEIVYIIENELSNRN